MKIVLINCAECCFVLFLFSFIDSAPVEIPHSGMRKQRKGALTKKDRDELEALKGGEGMVCVFDCICVSAFMW